MSFYQLSVAINRALMRFQFIEEGMRVYLDSAYLLVKATLDGTLPVRLTRKQIESKTLRQLVGDFEKFNDNESLISDIRDLIEDRNFVAHQAFLVVGQRLLADASLSEEIDKLASIADKAEKCVEALRKELRDVEAKLHKEIPG